jgi:hypothetical protein
LKTSEEALCDEENVCNWTFEGTNIPIISAATLEFSSSSQEYQLTIEGSNMNMDGADL